MSNPFKTPILTSFKRKYDRAVGDFELAKAAAARAARAAAARAAAMMRNTPETPLTPRTKRQIEKFAITYDGRFGGTRRRKPKSQKRRKPKSQKRRKH